MVLPAQFPRRVPCPDLLQPHGAAYSSFGTCYQTQELVPAPSPLPPAGRMLANTNNVLPVHAAVPMYLGTTRVQPSMQPAMQPAVQPAPAGFFASPVVYLTTSQQQPAQPAPAGFFSSPAFPLAMQQHPAQQQTAGPVMSAFAAAATGTAPNAFQGTRSMAPPSAAPQHNLGLPEELMPLDVLPTDSFRVSRRRRGGQGQARPMAQPKKVTADAADAAAGEAEMSPMERKKAATLRRQQERQQGLDERRAEKAAERQQRQQAKVQARANYEVCKRMELLMKATDKEAAKQEKAREAAIKKAVKKAEQARAKAASRGRKSAAVPVPATPSPLPLPSPVPSVPSAPSVPSDPSVPSVPTDMQPGNDIWPSLPMPPAESGPMPLSDVVPGDGTVWLSDLLLHADPQ